MIEEKIKELIKKAVLKSQEDFSDEINLSTPQLQFGDFSSNIALILAKKMKRNPMELAEEIKSHMDSHEDIESVQVLKPGFINVWLSKTALIIPLEQAVNETFVIPPFSYGPEKKVMVEFAHPNTHKLLHIGHLRNIATGESVCRMLAAAGNKVIRTNYQGDVGLHIAKCLWGVKARIKKDGEALFEKLTLQEKIQLLGKGYSEGQTAYDADEKAKAEIIEINKQIYIQDPQIKELWIATREWSVAYFEERYKRLYSHFDRCYFESEVHEQGLKTAKELLEKGILEKSQGAVVFNGEKYGMDTRVFINSLGFPTYEGKELGLAPKEFSDFGTLDKAIHVVTPEQTSFFKITFKVEELWDKEKYGNKQYHLAYEWVKLKDGKMSSRTGNVIEASWLLDEIKKKILERFKNAGDIVETLAVAAVKYSFLKNATNSIISFDIDESVSLDGNSAPYLLYTYVRTKSILSKETENSGQYPKEITPDEKQILRLIYQYTDKVYKAASTLSPNILAGYLYELCREYNVFYQKNPILKADPDQKYIRITITKAVSNIIKHGLDLLGIKTVQKM
ncbi:arginine--tRNA ligase [Candidatus Roizmanbacteria bacterium CG03_land_8_20_14_0_80_39_12]|uniref:Arginine--tRNA ligase n=2 Tax=Candidatus Roizmaniibacteriota TaxID=1752723 RepID=A0A2M7BT86_9BACT|nr:MAG: arginine--tRNA ligase [Candidatus Roizmanbacteria bacterium CG03_land_8_20_14_0_80_39_12]